MGEIKKRKRTPKKTLDERLKETQLLKQKSVFNIEDVSAYTGFSQSWIYKMTSKMLIPFSKTGGKKLFFEKAKIDEWLLRNKKTIYGELDSIDTAPEWLQKELFKRHSHAGMLNEINPSQIVYTEKSVIEIINIILQKHEKGQNIPIFREEKE